MNSKKAARGLDVRLTSEDIFAVLQRVSFDDLVGLPADESLSPESLVALAELEGQIIKVLRTLTFREAQILRNRFGASLGSEYREPMLSPESEEPFSVTIRRVMGRLDATLRSRSAAEKGEQQFAVTRKRLREIEAVALRKLRPPEKGPKKKK